MRACMQRNRACACSAVARARAHAAQFGNGRPLGRTARAVTSRRSHRRRPRLRAAPCSARRTARPRAWRARRRGPPGTTCSNPGRRSLRRQKSHRLLVLGSWVGVRHPLHHSLSPTRVLHGFVGKMAHLFAKVATMKRHVAWPVSGPTRVKSASSRSNLPSAHAHTWLKVRMREWWPKVRKQTEQHVSRPRDPRTRMCVSSVYLLRI